MTVFVVQEPVIVGWWPRRRYRRWANIADTPVFRNRPDAEAAVEDWLDGDWSMVVHHSGGIDVVESMHTYMNRAGNPLARFIEMVVS